MQKVSLRVTPRLVLEVNRHNAICVATNVPEFYNARGDLNIRDLRAHVKARMISSQFCGYVLVSLLDSEDQVDHLNIFPHVFSERMINVELSDSIISFVASYNSVPILLMVLSCPNSRQTHLSLRLFILEWSSWVMGFLTAGTMPVAQIQST